MNSNPSGCKAAEKGQHNCKKALDHCQSRMTDLEKFAQSLVDKEARAESILETAVDGIIIISSQGVIESFNPAAEKIFGYTAQEVIGQKVNILMPQPHRSRHDGYIQSYLRNHVATASTIAIVTTPASAALSRRGSLLPNPASIT